MARGRVEPAILSVDKEVQGVLEKGGIWGFLSKFPKPDVVLATELARSWAGGYVEARGTKFAITPTLISEVSGIKSLGIKVNRYQHSLKYEVILFRRQVEKKDSRVKFQNLVQRDSLPSPWDRVVLVIMQYITLDVKQCIVRSFHFAILNHIIGNQIMDIPTFLFNSLDKSMLAMQNGRYSTPKHAGLLTLLFHYVVVSSTSPSSKLGLTCESSSETSSKSESLNSESTSSESSSEEDSNKESGVPMEKEDLTILATLVKVMKTELGKMEKVQKIPSEKSRNEKQEKEKVEPSHKRSKRLRQQSSPIGSSPYGVSKNLRESSPLKKKGKCTHVAKKQAGLPSQSKKNIFRGKTQSFKGIRNQIGILEETWAATLHSIKLSLNNVKEFGVGIQELKQKIQSMKSQDDFTSSEKE